MYETVVFFGPLAVAAFLGWLAGDRIVPGRVIGAIAIGAVAGGLALGALTDDGGTLGTGDQIRVAAWAGLVMSALVTAFVVPMVATRIWRNYERELNEPEGPAPHA